jgi:flagella basal body P-ring formation protein FlgA
MSITLLQALRFGLSLIPLIALSTAASATGKQDLRAVEVAAANFLHVQSVGLPGQIEVTVTGIDARTSLPACAALEPSLPPGSRPWGHTAVTMRCLAPHAWTLYVRANVKVLSDYVVSTRPLMPGRPIEMADLALHRGDLTQLPAGVATDPAQIVGRTPSSSLPIGSPLRQDMLRAQAAVLLNQGVKLVSGGRGFSVTADGRALNNAAEGQPVQVRSGSGPVVSGIARAGAVVEVSY